MGKKSSTKGKSFEREIVKILNTTYETDAFTRTPQSGAKVGLSNWDKFSKLSKNIKQVLSSDIITPEWYPYAIEAKWYADKPNYSTLIKSNDTTLDGWLGEVLFDAGNTARIPMLWFKTNSKGIHIAVPKIFEKDLELAKYVTYDEFIIFGADFYNHNKSVFVDLFPKQIKNIIHWMENSTKIEELVTNMLLDKQKR